MSEIIKKIFVNPDFGLNLLKTLNIKSNGFTVEIYNSLKRLINMPYDCKALFPYRIVEVMSLYQNPSFWMVVDNSIKTQKKYFHVRSIYNDKLSQEVIGLILNHHKINAKLVTPFPKEYGFEWFQRNNGLAKARETAKKAALMRGILIVQSDYKWWSMVRFNVEYVAQIRKALDMLSIKYEIVLPEEQA